MQVMAGSWSGDSHLRKSCSQKMLISEDLCSQSGFYVKLQADGGWQQSCLWHRSHEPAAELLLRSFAAVIPASCTNGATGSSNFGGLEMGRCWPHPVFDLNTLVQKSV